MLHGDKEIEHYDKDFSNITYEGKLIKGRFFDTCRFYSSNLKECVFEDCQFESCTFINCDISLLQLKRSIFNGVKIDNSKAIGITWVDAENPLNLQFNNSNISYCSFFGKNLRKINITDCIAHDVDFANCNLSGASFTGTDLLNARFVGTDLSLANFTDAVNYSINVQENNIKKAKFKLPEALTLLQSLNIILVD
jgi:fluoroquinolone resistance protein